MYNPWRNSRTFHYEKICNDELKNLKYNQWKNSRTFHYKKISYHELYNLKCRLNCNKNFVNFACIAIIWIKLTPPLGECSCCLLFHPVYLFVCILLISFRCSKIQFVDLSTHYKFLLHCHLLNELVALCERSCCLCAWYFPALHVCLYYCSFGRKKSFVNLCILYTYK